MHLFQYSVKYSEYVNVHITITYKVKPRLKSTTIHCVYMLSIEIYPYYIDGVSPTRTRQQTGTEADASSAMMLRGRGTRHS